MVTYLMDGSVFEFVLFFSVENETVFFDVTYDGGLPSGTFQKSYQTVKNPILIDLKHTKSVTIQSFMELVSLKNLFILLLTFSPSWYC